MEMEIKLLDRINQKAENDCRVKFVPKESLPKGQRPYGNVLGYKINGLKKHPYCKWMAINEPDFIEIMRQRQNKRAQEKS